MRTSTIPRRLALIAALLLIVGACSVAEDTAVAVRTSEPVSERITVPVSTTSTEPTVVAATDPEPPSDSTVSEDRGGIPISPVETALPYLRLTRKQVQDLVIAGQRRYEEELATCMRVEGFDYVPIDVTQPALLSTPVGPLALTEDEFRDQYGYGAAFNARLAFEPMTATFINPNVDIVEALGESEREAYDAQMRVCRRLLQETLPNPFDPPLQREGDEPSLQLWLMEQLALIDEAVGKDPRVLAAEDSWSRCMASEGYDLASPADAYEFIAEQAAPIVARVSEGLTDEIEEALQDLQVYELQVSDADGKCAEELELDETMRTVRFELETKFLEENGDRVALLAAEKEAALEAYRDFLDN